MSVTSEVIIMQAECEVPALRMLPTEVGNDVENSRVRALGVILENAHIDILKVEKITKTFHFSAPIL